MQVSTCLKDLFGCCRSRTERAQAQQQPQRWHEEGLRINREMLRELWLFVLQIGLDPTELRRHDRFQAQALERLADPFYQQVEPFTVTREIQRRLHDLMQDLLDRNEFDDAETLAELLDDFWTQLSRLEQNPVIASSGHGGTLRARLNAIRATQELRFAPMLQVPQLQEQEAEPRRDELAVVEFPEPPRDLSPPNWESRLRAAHQELLTALPPFLQKHALDRSGARMAALLEQAGKPGQQKLRLSWMICMELQAWRDAVAQLADDAPRQQFTNLLERYREQLLRATADDVPAFDLESNSSPRDELRVIANRLQVLANSV